MAAENVPLTFVDSTQSLEDLLERIVALPTGVPSLYVDLEGVSLSRHGTISLLVIFIPREQMTYIVDVHTLGSAAFTTPARKSPSTTLKSILESAAYIKVFFDVRNDSDALHAHFGVRLAGVEDVQLMENAARPARGRRFVNGLERCIVHDAPLAPAVRTAWQAAKEKGLRLFHPSKGGAYERFNVRPLDPDLARYCANDVRFLPALRELYWARLGPNWRRKVELETVRRVQLSQSPGYEPQGESKKFGPWP